RAVNDALPVLERATEVTVLSIDADGGCDRPIPGTDMALHLARHGISATVDAVPGAGRAGGDVVGSCAAESGVGLVVMGGARLGRPTRHLLRHMTTPVLMSH